ncbi:protein TonB [Meinhardsimonia xiamenensis]|jgi:protein TonB|uniref:Protein TonB n=1 Tax=Meinhardsimonia xiamenensis TaxID=990712 RepID=A0A1G9ENN1_9RHOB|nr:TonB family protein [Meinhardsimonia xiamenensis]PRX33690.1 outer membrane transport energization protein TonB [Meinhardsimonia xiamenensis]SDK77782.1 protein TonB [Meinhardsimonia xiamenensis]
MIPSSPLARITAFAAALAVHALGAVAMMPRGAVMIEAAGGTAELRLGDGFADLAAGTVQPLEAETVKPARTEARPAQAAPASATRAMEGGRLSTAPTSPAAELLAAGQPAPRAVPVPAQAPPAAKTAVIPSPAVAALPVTATPARRELTPAAQARQETPTDTTAAAPKAQPARTVVADRVQGTAPQTAQEQAPSPAAAPRPPQRPAARDGVPRAARETATRSRPETSPGTSVAAAPRGSARRDMRAGAATGQAEAGVTRSGAGAARGEVGNAAVSNYPGQVFGRLARMGKPRVRAQGAAIVAFTVGTDGRLTGIALARSSGSAELDRAAIRLVRAAAPFPRPPLGARRSFTVEIRAR